VRVLILSVGIVVVDQLTKMLVKGLHIPALGIAWEGLPYGISRPVLGDFFRLTYIENPGMVFGIDIGGKPFFSLFHLAASIAIIIYLYKVRRGPLGFRIALAMILGGAVGNLIDRLFYGLLFDYGPLFYGRVVDFFDLDFFDVTIFGYHMSRWAVFNVSDACVTVGVILLLFFHRWFARAEEPLPAADDRT